jgi:ferredoxin
MRMQKPIYLHADRCSGCLRCALACSFFTTPERAFNLSASKIVVLPGWEQGPYEVSFAEDCNGCGICIRYCAFGVLSRSPQEARHV